MEVVTDLCAEFNIIALHRLDHSKETEIDHKSRVQVLGNISVREGVTMDLFTILALGMIPHQTFRFIPACAKGNPRVPGQ